MKTTLNKSQQKNIKTNNSKTRPEVRDNLDSRSNEEQDFKGDDTTHNAKPHHNLKSGKK